MTKAKTVKPNITMRGTAKFWVHHFKASLGMMKKNRSYQYGIVKIDELEHVHIYHSKNSQGRPMKYTAPVGGHYHEVDVVKDAEGNIVAKCGPAMQDVHKKMRNGKMKKLRQAVKWYDDEKADDVIDGHTHTMEYLDSEHLSPDKIKKIQDQNQQSMSQFASTKEDDFGL